MCLIPNEEDEYTTTQPIPWNDQLRKLVSQAEARRTNRCLLQHHLACANPSDLAGWCISLSSVVFTSDIAAPGVLTRWDRAIE